MERLYQHFLEGWPLLLDGALLTVELVAISSVLGVLLAIPVALARLNGPLMLRWPATAFVTYFRGTPLLVQLFLIYYGPGQFEWIQDSIAWDILSEPYWCALIALTCNTTGYVAEVFRGAIEAVPQGEKEAGLACGMSAITLYRRIILPRALRMSLPALSNEIILLSKASAVVSIVTLKELMGNARLLGSKTLAYVDYFILAGILYLIINYGIALLFRLAEKRYNAFQAARR